MLYIHRFSIFDNQDAAKEDDLTLSKVQHYLQDTKETLEIIDQQNKTLSQLSAAIEENKLKLSEMRELQDQMRIENNKATSLEFCLSSQQSSNNS